jgi:hypothetical protein
MGSAWKLRALVYGLLLLVAALVLVQRASTSVTARVEPEPVIPEHRLVGLTAQGHGFRVVLRGRRVLALATVIAAKCAPGTHTDPLVHWTRSTAAAGLSYVSGRAPGEFLIHDGVSPSVGSSMSAWLSPDMRHITGWVMYRSDHGCTSGWVRFSARR